MHTVYGSSFDNARYLRTFPTSVNRANCGYEFPAAKWYTEACAGAVALWGGTCLTQLRCPFAKSFQRNVAYGRRKVYIFIVYVNIILLLFYTHRNGDLWCKNNNNKNEVESIRTSPHHIASRSPNWFQLRSERNPHRPADDTAFII